ncbi:hypothetical protein HZS_2314 [Henneguya salminicola]|nr:hypothetical protein HZS_2314 [Henneguya salminicola]
MIIQKPSFLKKSISKAQHLELSSLLENFTCENAVIMYLVEKHIIATEKSCRKCRKKSAINREGRL